ncbi:MAG: carboxypeptidase-like regulatory domain-containing protein [Terracidiphilus sp.]|jgi:hypothetical protein
MFDRLHFPVCVLVASLGLSLSPLVTHAQTDNYHGRKYKAPPPSAHIEVTVLKDFNGKPITNAHVIFHPTEGDRDKGALEVKTNEDGKATIDVIPVGDTVTLQVIANGYQTYGQSYKIDKPELTMEIRMKRPGGQYSIYKNPDGGSSNSTPNPAPPASGDKSSGSASQPNSQSQPSPK